MANGRHCVSALRVFMCHIGLVQDAEALRGTSTRKYDRDRVAVAAAPWALENTRPTSLVRRGRRVAAPADVYSWLGVGSRGAHLDIRGRGCLSTTSKKSNIPVSSALPEERDDLQKALRVFGPEPTHDCEGGHHTNGRCRRRVDEVEHRSCLSGHEHKEEGKRRGGQQRGATLLWPMLLHGQAQPPRGASRAPRRTALCAAALGRCRPRWLAGFANRCRATTSFCVRAWPRAVRAHEGRARSAASQDGAGRGRANAFMIRSSARALGRSGSSRGLQVLFVVNKSANSPAAAEGGRLARRGGRR